MNNVEERNGIGIVQNVKELVDVFQESMEDLMNRLVFAQHVEVMGGFINKNANSVNNLKRNVFSYKD